MIALWIALSLGPASAGDEDFDLSRMDEVVGQEPWGSPVTGVEAEERTANLAAGLRCPVCQGMSVNDSSTEAAVSMKTRIQELVEQGYTDDQITDYFVARYGVWILLAPPKDGVNWLLYTIPGLIALMGIPLVYAMQGGREEKAEAETTEEPVDDYTKRVLAELDD
ncbi:MAG: hypothetical protein GY913_11240 [Proteobacteria bacterium]|nr:hypothetical protein [Pseudomonadota bacterium]MCP4917488.1 hypothetical protein [Pseudomonadota bacterium]